MVSHKVVLSPDARLSRCERQQISLEIPGPLNERLDELVRLADDEGSETNRRELVSAILLDAPSSQKALARLVRRYRTALVRDAALPGLPIADLIELKPRRPGPRPRGVVTGRKP